MASYKIQPLSTHVSLLAETPFWDEDEQRLFYVDCFPKTICSLDPLTEQTIVTQTNVDSAYVAAAVPFAKNSKNYTPGDMLVFTRDQIIRFNLNRPEENGNILYEANKGANFTFDDGKCDLKGRIWMGTSYIESFNPLVVDPQKGALVCIDETFKPIPKAGNIQLANGLTWNSNYTKLYFADSLKKIINVYDFDLESGTLGAASIFFDLDAQPELKGLNNFPDGLTMDIQGNLYMANWQNGMIVKIDTSTGKILDIIRMPITNVTSLCFGGKDYKDLLVTSASVDLGLSKIEGQPGTGKVFKVTSEKENSFIGFSMNKFGGSL